MKNNPSKYYFLLASLPYIPQLFANKQMPISREALEERLNVLDEKEAEALAYLEAVLSGDEFPEGENDEEVTISLEVALSKIKSSLLSSVIRDMFELRSYVALFRRRQRGGECLTRDEIFGFIDSKRDREHIELNWEADAFKLEPFMPYLPAINKVLLSGESFELEKLILGLEWNYLTEATRKVSFDFDATALYVLRWDLADRWIKYNNANPAEEFNKLVGLEYDRAIENLEKARLEKIQLEQAELDKKAEEENIDNNSGE